MRRFYFILIFACISISALAQTTVSLGTLTGSGSTNVLLSTSTTGNRYSRTISIYTAAEIMTAGGAAGTITSLAWDKSGTGEYTTNDAYIKVSLKHVSNTTWSTSPVPDWTTEIVGATDVFTSTTYSIPTGTGWKSVPFTTPFVWNGVDNIAVFVEWDRSSTPTGSINWGRSTNTDANATRVGSTSLAALVMLVNSSRPLVQFVINTVPITSLTVNTVGSVPAVINTHGGTLGMQATVLPATAAQVVNWSIVPVTGSATISSAGVVTATGNGTVWAKAVSPVDATKRDSMLITISNQIEVSVNTVGSVPAVINTFLGTLNMQATVTPASAPQTVNWSIVPVTGAATISTAGVVTAQNNGTVWAKAVSTADATKKDSMLVTISNQISVSVNTVGSVPAIINTSGGTLNMQATITPASAPQTVTWSIVPGTGAATISSAGVVTAQNNGTVWAKAVSVADPTKADSMEITMSNQPVPITSIDVRTQGGVPASIITPNGTLQLQALILPATANQAVTWSLTPVTGAATISATGLVTAQLNGTVRAKAVSVFDPTKTDSLLITLTNQPIPIVGISVATQGGVAARITTIGGTLQMQATIFPLTASQDVTWSVINGTGSAGISATGLVTALSNGGNVWAKAVSVQDPTKADSLEIIISTPATGIAGQEASAGLIVYPNPVVNKILNVLVKDEVIAPDAILTIVEVSTGKIVKSQRITTPRFSVDLNGMASGIYTARWINGNTNGAVNFVVE